MIIIILLINAKCIKNLFVNNGKFTFKKGHIYPTRLGVSSHSFLALCEERQWVNLSRENPPLIYLKNGINSYDKYKFVRYSEYFQDINKRYVANKKELNKLSNKYDFTIGKLI